METFFKNTELAALYGISEGTVRNWVRSAREGKLAIEVVDHSGHTYVAKNISNIPIIEDLVRHNRKYRNTLASKTVEPSGRLFEVFNVSQVYDIIRNLELYHEIPVQYSYFGQGAKEWDDYIKRQAVTDAPSMYSRTVELLAANQSYIDVRLAKYGKINVIDVGVGNAMPVRELISRFLGQGKAVRYVGVDFCPDMLDVAQKNLEEWFGGAIEFERRELDIAHDVFADVSTSAYLQDEDSVNVVLFLGATPNNLRVREDAFRTIQKSMNPDDLLVYSDKLEPEDAPPEWYEHGVKYGKSEVMSLLRLVYDLLEVDESLYDVEVGFDRKTDQRYARTRFKTALSIRFDFGGVRKTISFEKGEAVILWRCWQTTPRSLLDLLDTTGFYTLHTSQSEDHNYILAIAEVKRS